MKLNRRTWWKNPSGRSRCVLEGFIGDFGDIMYESFNWIRLARDRLQRRALVKAGYMRTSC